MSCLFISSSFFGYAEKISRKLETYFGKVHWFEDRPSVSVFGKAAARLAPDFLERLSFDYFQKISKAFKSEEINFVFIIKGEMLSPLALEMLRGAYPFARFVLYFWDSYKNMPKSSWEKVGLVDKALSFDLEDVKSDCRLTYRPLFFTDDYVNIEDHQNLPSQSYDSDLLFLGTDHTDRFNVLNSIYEKYSSLLSMKFILYSPSKALFYLKRSIRGGGAGIHFVFEPINSEGVNKLIRSSRAVLDIERVVQTGFTMRTLEVLATQRKLVSTNANLVNADFYDNRNIALIDRDRLDIPLEIFESPFVPLDDKLLFYYSIDGWLSSMIEV